MKFPQTVIVLLIGALLATAAPLKSAPPTQVSPAPSTAAPFKEAEVFQTLPKGAKLVPRAEHEKLLRNGDAFLISNKAERDRRARADAAKLARRQKAAHAALKNDSKAIAALNAIPEYEVNVKVNTLTGPRDFAELGRRDLIEMIASSAELPSNRINAQEAYRFAHELLPSSQRVKFTVPDKIGSFPLVRIKQDTAAMMKVASLLNRHTTRLALNNAVVWEPPNDLQYPDPDCIDREFNANGLMKKFDFALKPHLGRVRDQQDRATCWAFAAVAAIEANAHKNTGNWHNLSEQDLIKRHKLGWHRDWATHDFHEGDSSGRVLNMAVEKNYRFAVESQQEYNPSLKRKKVPLDAPTRFEHSCDDYGPECSDTNHQALQICHSVGPLGPDMEFCSYWAFPLHRTTFVSRRVADIWKAGDQDGSLQELRTTLESGTPVALGFSTTASWRGITPDDPYLDVPAGPEPKLGAHYVLIVGYIPRAEVAAAGIPADLLDGVDDDWIIIRNSYGRCWGDAGYAYVPATHLKTIFASFNSAGNRIGVVELFVVPTPVTL